MRPVAVPPHDPLEEARVIRVDVLEVEARWEHWLALLDSGLENEILITRNGQPAAWLVGMGHPAAQAAAAAEKRRPQR